MKNGNVTHTGTGSDAASDILPSNDELIALYNEKYGDQADLGWSPKLRRRFDYFTPDDYYEAVVKKLVADGCAWADVGCGRDIFPSNTRLAATLSSRAEFVLGVDPDDNIRDNPFVTEAVQGYIEDVPADRKYDVITLRMVAEHIADPQSAVRGIDQLAESGAYVVIYTPNKWAPMSIFARLTPTSVHHFFKKILWNTEERDTFPVQFKMNTRKRLREVFQPDIFDEVHFSLLDDCRTFAKYYALSYAEIAGRSMLNKYNINYPENCVLAVYRKK